MCIRDRNTTVTDSFPPTLELVQWECIPSSGAVCSPTTTFPAYGSLVQNPILIKGASVMYKVTARVMSSATGALTNLVTATIAYTDPNPGNNVFNDTDTLTPQADLRIFKDDGGLPVIAGNYLTYSIDVFNYGPSDAPLGSIVVTDNFSTKLGSPMWTCPYPTNCTASNTSNINDANVRLLYLGHIRYIITAQVLPSVNTSIDNWASITTSSSLNSTDKSDDVTKVTTVIQVNADLSVSKTDNTGTIVPGAATTYTISVYNYGPSDANNVYVKDTFSSKFQNAIWNCTATTRAACSQPYGSGDINSLVSVGLNNNVTFTITATLLSNALGQVINEVNLTSLDADKDEINNYSYDSDTIVYFYDLSIGKTDNVGSVTPGKTVTYTITVKNLGPSDTPFGGACVVDLFDSQLYSVMWNCVPSGSSSCTLSGANDIIDSQVAIPAGSQIIYTATGMINASALFGNLTNQASVGAINTFGTDSWNTNNIATDTDILLPSAALDIQKTDYPPSSRSTPGNYIYYQVTVRNLGPSDSGFVSVQDAFSVNYTSISWTCIGYGSTCGSSIGTGPLDDRPYLAVGGTLLYTLKTLIVASAAGNITNTATVIPRFNDTNLSDNVATDSNLLFPAADVFINKTDMRPNATPGTILTYSVTVTNTGPSDVLYNSVSVLDAFPAIYQSPGWTCTASTNSSCGMPSGFANPLSDLPTIRAGGSVLYIITGKIASSQTGNITNSAKVVVYDGNSILLEDPDTSNNVATDYDLLLPSINLITNKTDNVQTATPGLSVTYTINITNNGPSDGLFGRVTVTDDLSAFCSSAWACTALTPTASCGASAGNGTGSFTHSPQLYVNDSISYIVTAKICSSSNGTMTNRVIASVSSGFIDPTPEDAAATDDDWLYPLADVSVTKTDNQNMSAPGAPFTYVITVTNYGPSDIPWGRLTVIDNFPSSLFILPISWTCTAVGGTCGSAGASTDINDTPALIVGGRATYQVKGSTRADLGFVSLLNTASAKVQGGGTFIVTDNNPTNNYATDNNTLTPAIDMSVTKTDNKLIVSPGQTLTYTMNIKNLGPSDSSPLAVNVTDFFNVRYDSYSWDCTCSLPVACSFFGTISGTNTPIIFTAGFPVLSAMQCTATATIMNGNLLGALDNTLSADLDPSGGTDPVLSNNDGLDRDGLNSTSNVFVKITDSVSSAIPGTTVTYTVVIGNKGPARIDIQPDQTAALVSWVDSFPSIITSFSWACVPIASTGPDQPTCGTLTSRQNDPNTGAGFVYTETYLPQGTSINFFLTAKISSAATGSLENPFKALLFFSVTDDDLSDNIATDTDLLTPRADIKVEKVIVGGGVIPGRLNTFTIRVSNLGPSDAPQIQISDPFPSVLSNIESVQCVAVSPSSCGTTQPSSSGLTATADIKAGTSVEYTLVFDVAADVPDDPNCVANNGHCLVNTATASVVGTGVQLINTADDVSRLEAPITRKIGYSVVKAGPLFIPLAGDFTYTITVTNSGPSVFPGTFGDDLDPLIAPTDDSSDAIVWNCKGSGGAVCGPIKSGDSEVNFRNNFVLPIGGSLTYTLVTSLATQQSDRILVSNTAFVEPNDGESQTKGTSEVFTNGGNYNIDVSKSASPTSAFQGNKIVWTVVIKRNSGDGPTAVSLTDSIPSTCTSPTWTCTGLNCPSKSGSGSISRLQIAMTNDGDTVTFKITCTASAAGSITNTAGIRIGGFNKGTSTSSATVSVSGSCPFRCADGTCAESSSSCTGLNTGGLSTSFDNSGGFVLSAGETKLILSLGDIKELDSDGRVVYAESLQDQDFNITGMDMVSYTGKPIQNVNFTATLHNGAFFRIAYYLFSAPDVYPVGSIKLDIAGPTNKFSIIVADWPFEDFDVHSFQIDIGFDTGGDPVNDPCLLENSNLDKRITQSQFQTADGIVSVQVLQFATLDGVETTVSADILADKLVLTTPCFFIDMIYDPDFSVLLGGSAASGGSCNSANQDALLNASIGALSGAFGFAAFVIGFYIFWDKRKKYLRKAARTKAQEAYHTGARPSTGGGSINASW
eukprot:TRINITY_DN479_c0_g4_i1.p1 TRINITY_DN479_c0_g4~~TRINITY_DN479_c0_g4_i1.p1  ORF type:complete len:2037 (-),score=289.79 TRINITY_DN479_c0_g4_i1:270-6380(-)